MIRVEVFLDRHWQLAPLASWLHLMGRRSFPQSIADNCLCLFQNTMQLVRSLEAFCIDLVDIFSPRWTCCEPSAFGNYLQASDGGTVTRRVGKDGLDFFASQVFDFDLLRRELL